jgi:hypothetical protein
MTPEYRGRYAARLSVACAAFGLGGVIGAAHRDPFATAICVSVTISVGLVQLLLPRGKA